MLSDDIFHWYPNMICLLYTEPKDVFLNFLKKKKKKHMVGRGNKSCSSKLSQGSKNYFLKTLMRL